MNEEMRLLLESTQLIIRDRTWNNKNYEVMSKITDANISKLLNPIAEPTISDKIEGVLSEGAKE